MVSILKNVFTARGWVDEDLDLDDRVFVCIACGYIADRDYNAAKNLAQTEQSADMFTILEEMYRELHGNITPVEREALA
jgi:Putative transposase DNA-binding domain